MQQETKPTSTAGITFAVSDVERATKPLRETPYAEALSFTLGQDGGTSVLEAYSRNTKPLVSLYDGYDHLFIYAANLAYDDHRPLVLSPDMIWLLIAQGVAMHINAHAETLRSRFVAHEGKAEITVQRDEFVRGFAGNDWESVFAEFSEQIRAYVGKQGHELIVRRFSTTGIVERAAYEVTLMDAYQAYFNPMLGTMCGIPEITLEGTPDDWKSIREGAAELSDYDLHWWTEHLLPVLDQFVAASKGDIDLSFWRNFYKLYGGSGGHFINGHIVNLFPYLMPGALSPDDQKRELEGYQKGRNSSYEVAQAWIDKISKKNSVPFRNTYLGWSEPVYDRSPPPARDRSSRSTEDSRAREGIDSGLFPPALSVAPFTWQYYDQQLPMEFVAGFVGVAQDPETLAVRPEIGWAVRERRGEAAETSV